MLVTKVRGGGRGGGGYESEPLTRETNIACSEIEKDKTYISSGSVCKCLYVPGRSAKRVPVA